MEHYPRGATCIARPCPFGHMQCAVREAPRGAQAIFDIQCLLSVFCLKASEHEF
jgi:hypothetical protein